MEFTTVTSNEELFQILKLQQKNLPQHISEDERLTQGFVTVHHTFDLLKRMNDVQHHIIAKSKEQVIGYVLCMHPKFGNDIEILLPMFKEIESTNAKDYIVMGQICIEKDYRGKGIFRKLYETLKVEVAPKFSNIITEVDIKNKRSLSAHYAAGFKDLSTYEANGQLWKLIILSI